MPLIQPSAFQYARMMTMLMPPGRMRTDAASNLFKVLLGAADELARVSVRVADMFREIDPRQTLELLPEFERMLNLSSDGTVEQRRARVISALLRRPRIRPADIQTVLAPLLALDPEDMQVIELSRAYAILVGDAREIYRFHVYRDPTLPGDAQIEYAQTVLDSMAQSHTKGHVIESIAALCDDEFSLCDRDILGGTAADTFQVASGLAPDYFWAGQAEDVVSTHELTAAGEALDDVAVVALRRANGFSQRAWQFTDGTSQAWTLGDTAIFDFDATNGPSWLFVLAFRTLVPEPPETTRALYWDSTGLAGSALLMADDGSLTWGVGSGSETVPGDYADGRWHVVAVRWRYDTDSIQVATELESSADTVIGASGVSSPGAAQFGSTFAFVNALGCQVAMAAACSGEQVHGADLGQIAEDIHAIIVNPLYNAAGWP